MTNAEQQTKEALFASSALLVLVGVNADNVYKLFPDEIPEKDALPAVVYERVDAQPEYTLEGDLAASRVSMSISGWAKTRAQANAIGLAITDAMTAAGHAQTSASGPYEPELDEYAAVRIFDVWEL